MTLSHSLSTTIAYFSVLHELNALTDSVVRRGLNFSSGQNGLGSELVWMSSLWAVRFPVRFSPNILGGKLKSHGIWWQTSEYTLNQDGKCRRVFGTMRDTLCISPLSRVKRAPSEVISARRPQKTVNGMRSFLHFIRMFYFTSTPTRVLDHQGFIFWKDAHVNESLRSRCPLLAKTHLTSWWVQRFFNIPV